MDLGWIWVLHFLTLCPNWFLNDEIFDDLWVAELFGR